MFRHRPSWEGLLLAFALIFTVLIGLAYVFANFFRLSIPWLALLVLALALALLLSYARRRPGA